MFSIFKDPKKRLYTVQALYKPWTFKIVKLPCLNCILQPCCSISCNKYLKFMMIDNDIVVKNYGIYKNEPKRIAGLLKRVVITFFYVINRVDWTEVFLGIMLIFGMCIMSMFMLLGIFHAAIDIYKTIIN